MPLLCRLRVLGRVQGRYRFDQAVRGSHRWVELWNQALQPVNGVVDDLSDVRPVFRPSASFTILSASCRALS